ncbi:MAG: DUF86 domain-containing protein [Chloroflexaceae bacterium]|nr:DUF86 domain-containing protein [Chloroflexaceae bacterium]
MYAKTATLEILTADEIVAMLRPMVAADQRISALWLFGSFATGHMHRNSDVDLGFLATDTISFDTELILMAEYAMALHIGAVDLVNITTASLPLQANILRGILIFAREPERVTAVSENVSNARRHNHYRYTETFLHSARVHAGRWDLIDKATVKRKLATLEACIQHLETLQGLSLEALTSDVYKADSLLHRFQIAIQSGLDALCHIVVQRRLAVPESNYEVISAAEQAGIIANDHAIAYRKMVGFRNRIVHLYDVIDLAIVYAALQHNFDNLRAFHADIAALIVQEENLCNE